MRRLPVKLIFDNNITLFMNLSSVKFIYFDIDDTLLDHSAAATGVLKRLHNEHSDSIGHIPADEFIEKFKIENKAVWLAMARRELTADEVKIQRFTRVLASFTNEQNDSWRHISQTLSKSFLDYYHEFWQLFPRAEEVLEAAESIAPVGLLSNGFPEQQFGKLRRFKWEKRFASIVLSSDADAMKPELAIFEYARAAAGINSPQNILYIGDSYETDIEGAKKAGWQTAWINHEDKQEPGDFADATVNSLEELLSFFN